MKKRKEKNFNRKERKVEVAKDAKEKKKEGERYHSLFFISLRPLRLPFASFAVNSYLMRLSWVRYTGLFTLADAALILIFGSA
ncbi:hypothetical protein AGMMS4952_12000 [Spirochaetia bacterium]|nr:hypothetical protein AGMMS4952_12000 [Spirochaetia bacterium]